MIHCKGNDWVTNLFMSKLKHVFVLGMSMSNEACLGSLLFLFTWNAASILAAFANLWNLTKDPAGVDNHKEISHKKITFGLRLV